MLGGRKAAVIQTGFRWHVAKGLCRSCWLNDPTARLSSSIHNIQKYPLCHCLSPLSCLNRPSLYLISSWWLPLSTFTFSLCSLFTRICPSPLVVLPSLYLFFPSDSSSVSDLYSLSCTYSSPSESKFSDKPEPHDCKRAPITPHIISTHLLPVVKEKCVNWWLNLVVITSELLVGRFCLLWTKTGWLLPLVPSLSQSSC